MEAGAYAIVIDHAPHRHDLAQIAVVGNADGSDGLAPVKMHFGKGLRDGDDKSIGKEGNKSLKGADTIGEGDIIGIIPVILHFESPGGKESRRHEGQKNQAENFFHRFNYCFGRRQRIFLMTWVVKPAVSSCL